MTVKPNSQQGLGQPIREPGSEVLAQVITDDKGRFAITEIPTTIPYQFLIRKPRSQLQPPWNDTWSSGPITFSDPGENNLASKVRNGAGSTKRLAVQTLRIKIVGEGVHGKKAVTDAAERASLLPQAVDLTFNANATAASVGATLRRVAWRSTVASPSISPRTLSVTVSDGNGLMSKLVQKQILLV